ncbi:Flp pilus assembly protein CpaB [Candidatus Omnitrophota bacterium]
MIHIERKWTIIAAAILGVLAVILTNFYFSQRESQFNLESRPVLVAAREIPGGTTIDYSMLALKPVPTRFIQPGALKAREMAVGKTALATIMSGEQVLQTKLAAPGRGLTLSGKTPPGKRAMTITLETADYAAGGMVKPGDHVDILAAFKKPRMTLTLFQDILILAVGSQMVAEQPKDAAGKSTPTRSRKMTVTLALSPQEVQIISVAQENGSLRLTLRPQMEKGEVMPSPDLSNLPTVVDLNTLLSFYIKRPTTEVQHVEVIRGLEKEMTPLPARK